MDPQLSAMMHGEFLKKKSSKESDVQKSQLEKEIDDEIDSFVDGMELIEDPAHNALQNTKMKRESMKLKIKEDIKIPELAQCIDNAMGIL